VLDNLGTQTATSADVTAAVQTIDSNITTQLTSLSAQVATNAMLIGQLQETSDRVLTQVQQNANMLAQIQREMSAPKQGVFGTIMSAIGGIGGMVSTVGDVLDVSSTLMDVGEVAMVAARRRRGTTNVTPMNNNTATELASVLSLSELNM
jgi:hypothetical protein